MRKGLQEFKEKDELTETRQNYPILVQVLTAFFYISIIVGSWTIMLFVGRAVFNLFKFIF